MLSYHTLSLKWRKGILIILFKVKMKSQIHGFIKHCDSFQDPLYSLTDKITIHLVHKYVLFTFDCCVRFPPLTLVFAVKFDRSCFNCYYINTKTINHHQISFNTLSNCKYCIRLLVYMKNCSNYTKNRH